MDLVEKHSTITSLGLPSGRMMYGMMRACIGVEQIQDLWIHELSNIKFNGAINVEQVQERAKEQKKKKKRK